MKKPLSDEAVNAGYEIMSKVRGTIEAHKPLAVKDAEIDAHIERVFCMCKKDVLNVGGSLSNDVVRLAQAYDKKKGVGAWFASPKRDWWKPTKGEVDVIVSACAGSYDKLFQIPVAKQIAASYMASPDAIWQRSPELSIYIFSKMLAQGRIFFPGTYLYRTGFDYFHAIFNFCPMKLSRTSLTTVVKALHRGRRFFDANPEYVSLPPNMWPEIHNWRLWDEDAIYRDVPIQASLARFGVTEENMAAWRKQLKGSESA